MNLPCVVLAGGKAKPELLAITGQASRALAIVNGKTLLRHVVDALQGVGPPGLIDTITVVGDVPDSTDYARLPDEGDFVANVFAGLSAHAGSEFVLIATSDLPFLTGEVVAGFVHGAVERAQESGAGVVWPIVPVAECYRRFPGVQRTSLCLRGGEFTGGNLALVRPAFLLANRERIADAYAARKSVVKMAWLLGLGTLGRLALSQTLSPNLLTIPMLEARVSRLMGGPVRALICAFPELATDLDRPSDFAAVGLPPLRREDA